MPRHTAPLDPLQHRHAMSALVRRHADPDPLWSGLGAIMPRLALVLAAAWTIQQLMHWFGR